jgi:6-pyruvoyl-tetrahydropterin synthase
MKSELILKFRFEASHSLSGYETPHPHLWDLEITVGGQPIEGRIVDIVTLRKRIETLVDEIRSTYLNENQRVTENVREFPTCETLSHFFYKELQTVLMNEFQPSNPSICLTNILVAILEMNGVEMGAARLKSE